MQKVARNGTIMQKLMEYMPMALAFAQATNPAMAAQIQADMAQMMGGQAPGPGGAVQLPNSDNIAGIGRTEPGIVANARSRAANAAQPGGGKMVNQEETK